MQKVKTAAENLKTFPESGSVALELADPEIREVVVGNYRLIYRYRQKTIEVLMIFHSARLLREEELEND